MKAKIIRSILNLISAIASNVVADKELQEIKYILDVDYDRKEYIMFSAVVSIEMYDILIANNQSFEYITISKDDYQVRLQCWVVF